MQNLSRILSTNQSIDLSAVQLELVHLYPEIISNITPLLKRLGYSPLACQKASIDYLNVHRAGEQVDLLGRYAGSLNGKRILEVGSGFGLFVAFTNKYMGAQTYGLEPAEAEFESTYQLSQKILRLWSVGTSLIKRGRGEAIPFPSNYFDVVYSTNVLEHVDRPEQVIRESIRVLKPGGIMQCIVPNYGSFWEGHYGIPWIPYLPKRIAKGYVQILRKDPWFIDTLCLINYFSLKKILHSHLKTSEVEIMDWGGALFIDRMTHVNFSSWGGLSILKKWVQLAHNIGVAGPLSKLLVKLKAHTPIVLTLRKKS